ncbi:MAG: hypothetical protein ABL900_10450 [Burkholderiaceae bacterium]
MKLLEGIRKHGFRKWYERELIVSHAYLVLLFFCAIGLLTSFSVYSKSAPWVDRALDAAGIALCAAVGFWSLRRYLFLLMHAEQVASQAVCSQCKTYGRLTIAAGQGRHGDSIQVRCRKCEHEWAIVDAG